MIYSPAHRLWRLLPRKWRRQLFDSLTTMLAPRPNRAVEGGPPITIAGAFRSASGVDEGARLALAALDAAGLHPMAFDLSSALDQIELAEAPNLRPLVAGSGGSLIVHVNGPYFAFASRALGCARIRGRHIIGYWAWELPRLPANWNSAFQFVHEIWVPSDFTRHAVATTRALPVHVVAHPLPPPEIEPFRRDEFGFRQVR
jgi:hypothetical protein